MRSAATPGSTRGVFAGKFAKNIEWQKRSRLRNASHAAVRSAFEALEMRQYLSGSSPEPGLVRGAINVPGEQDSYTFKLASDTKMYFDSRAGSSSIRWNLDGPAGRVVSARSFTASDGLDIGNPVLGLVAGDYTLSVNADNDVTGSYEFALFDLSAATLLTPENACSGGRGSA